MFWKVYFDFGGVGEWSGLLGVYGGLVIRVGLGWVEVSDFGGVD